MFASKNKEFIRISNRVFQRVGVFQENDKV